jgi:phenylpyruvate tautomerase PptA (4-oxalocrotonate tautomerase family)
MTIITVTSPRDRLSLDQRRELAETLTDAVLVPEIGQMALPARAGFQVHFVELDPNAMAIGGRLLSDQADRPDVMTIDVAVMDASWPPPVRAEVIANLLTAVAKVCGQAVPSPGWWVNFRVIDEGSWGSRGAAISILDLLATGVFTAERVTAIRAEIEGRARIKPNGT